ncbi:hypothetical protein FKP32DRAFT_1587946 [Trametes sanguinea]|nr:hypothetical protein FKP32DRAFT_1587946 [Trametes sanguinea]
MASHCDIRIAAPGTLCHPAGRHPTSDLSVLRNRPMVSDIEFIGRQPCLRPFLHRK